MTLKGDHLGRKGLGGESDHFWRSQKPPPMNNLGLMNLGSTFGTSRWLVCFCLPFDTNQRGVHIGTTQRVYCEIPHFGFLILHRSRPKQGSIRAVGLKGIDFTFGHFFQGAKTQNGRKGAKLEDAAPARARTRARAREALGTAEHGLRLTRGFVRELRVVTRRKFLEGRGPAQKWVG